MQRPHLFFYMAIDSVCAMKTGIKPRNILITGASSGIGEALALHYAEDGVFLALSGRNPERLAAVAQSCRSRGAIVETVLVDVSQQAPMAEWIERIELARPLDLVVANAGISGGTGGGADGETEAQVRAIFDVNLGGVLNTVLPVLPRMIARRSGQIALLSSLAGFRGFPSAPAYSASKGAVRFYGEALRGAVSNSGVKINVICPGFVKSRITDANDFKMPMLLEADKAARIIAKGLSLNKGRIVFPWPLHLAAWVLSALPDSWVQPLLRKLPAKSQNKAMGSD